KAESPVSSPRKAESPASSPRKAESPASSPRKAESPVSSPRKAESPASSPRKAESPASSPRMMTRVAVTPKSVRRRLATPTKTLTVQKSPADTTGNSLVKSPRGAKRKASLIPQPHISKKIRMGAATPKSERKTRTPKSKTPANPKKSFADALKKGLMTNGIPASRAERTKQVVPRARIARSKRKSTTGAAKMPENMFSTEVPKSFEFGKMTMGHANSPAPIFIHKKTSKTPKLFRKGRKGLLKAGSIGGSSSTGYNENLEGLDVLMASPEVQGEKHVAVELMKSLSESPTTPARMNHIPQSTSRRSLSRISTSTSFTNMTNFDFSSVETPNVTEDKFISPLATPVISSKTPERLLRSGKSMVLSPEVLQLDSDATTFDFENAQTPEVSQVDFVSPVSTRSNHSSPKTNEENSNSVPEAKRLLRTPRAAASTPKVDYRELSGITTIYETPCDNDSVDAEAIAEDGMQLGTQRPLSESPKANYTDVIGVRKLMKTAKAAVPRHQAEDAHILGIRKILRTPKPLTESPKADYTHVSGIKKLLKTPNVTSDTPKPDYTDVAGVRKLMKTPKVSVMKHKVDDSHITGIRKILRTPGLSPESPKADYTNVAGVKGIMKTPKATSPPPVTADYTNVAGMKRLLRTPNHTNELEPICDYTEIQGLQKLFRSPRRNPENQEIFADYCEPGGLKKLLTTPRQREASPLSDYTNVAGAKKLLVTPHTPVNSPEADYTNVHGIRALMRTPKVLNKSLEVDFEGLDQLLKTPLSDHTNMVISKVVELVQQSSTPGSGRKLRSSPKVITPATSSPSENIPPAGVKEIMDVINKEIEGGDITPRRSKRNAKVDVQETNIPVRRGRSRKGVDKNTDSSPNHIAACVLELIEASPVVPKRSLRSKKDVRLSDENPVTKKKSGKSRKISKEETQDMDMINKAGPVQVQDESTIDIESMEESSKIKEVTEDGLPDLLPTRTRNRRQAKSQSRKRIQTKTDVVKKSTKQALLVVPETVRSVSLDKTQDDEGGELMPEASASTQERRNPVDSLPQDEETKVEIPIRSSRGRRKAVVVSNSSTKVQLKCDDNTEAVKVDSGIILETPEPTAPKMRKTRARGGVKKTEVGSRAEQAPEEDRVSVRSRRRKAVTELEILSTKGELDNNKRSPSPQDKNKSTSGSSDEQGVRTTRRGRTRGHKILEEPVPELPLTRRKRVVKSNAQTTQEVVVALDIVQEEIDLASKDTESDDKTTLEEIVKSSSKANKNKSQKNEDNGHEVTEHKTSSKNDNTPVETPKRKRRAVVTTDEVDTTPITRSRRKLMEKESELETTPVTRSRLKNTKPVAVTEMRRTRSRK
ncbi:Proliferation marker protein Ki-67-like 1, partial [Homarus americanus]